MLDTSQGFNNLLKEVHTSSLRATNTSLDFRKSFSRTSTPARKSAPRSSALSDPMVNSHTRQNDVGITCNLCGYFQVVPVLPCILPFLKLFKLLRSQKNGRQPHR